MSIFPSHPAPSHRPAVLASVAALLLGSLVLGPTARAQEEAPGVFGEVIDVRVVNVEVVVTDRDGNRVPGLSSDDFRLTVDGVETPIQYFSEIRGGRVEPLAPGDGSGQGQRAGTVPTLEAGKPAGTSYLVFIDDFFPLKRDRDRVLDAFADELGALGPEDRLAVVAYDGKKLDMLTSWTGSPREAERAFEEARRRDTQGLQRLAALRTLDADAREFAGRPYGQRDFAVGRGNNEMTPYERAYTKRLDAQLENVVLAATATMRSFAAPPGRKVMIVLAGGWPLEPELYAVSSRDTPLTDDMDLSKGSKLYAELADTANLLGYTLYPVDIPGLQPDLVDAEDSVPADLEAGLEALRGIPSQDLQGGEGLVLTGNVTNQGLREFGIHGSLRYLAGETGGKPLINALRNAPFGTVVADTRSYYWLGFSPQRREDNQRHDIRVVIDRPGLDVRTRNGFLDFSRQREVSMMVESTLLFGNSPASEPLEVEVGRRQKAGIGMMALPLTITIPMDSVTMLPVGKGYAGQLELRVAAIDAEGRRSEVPVIPIRLRGDTPPPAGSHSVYETQVKLRRGTRQMVVSLYDPASGGILSTSLQLTSR